MGQFQRHISRSLIVILIAVGVIGGIFYIHNTSKAANRKSIVPNGARASGTPTDLPPLAGVSRVVTITTNTDPTTKPSAAKPTQLTTPSAVGNSLAGESPSTLPAAPVIPQPAAPVLNATEAHAAYLDGLVKKDADDLLTARRQLNDAIQSNALSVDEASKAKQALSDISQVVVFGKKIFGEDELGGSYTVQPGELMKAIAIRNNVTWEFLCRINDIADPKKLRAAATIKIIKGPFFAVVTKKAFTMDLYLVGPPGTAGSMYVMTYPVGLGRDDSTPTGTWLVEPHKKIKNPTYFSPRGEGVIDADDPRNPLGERWVGLTGVGGQAVGKQSYGVHGTIEPDSIGKMSSMGCIRMHNEDVEKVFDMLVEGKSTVTVK